MAYGKIDLRFVRKIPQRVGNFEWTGEVRVPNKYEPYIAWFNNVPEVITRHGMDNTFSHKVTILYYKPLKTLAEVVKESIEKKKMRKNFGEIVHIGTLY